jgi:hypothetical protein
MLKILSEDLLVTFIKNSLLIGPCRIKKKKKKKKNTLRRKSLVLSDAREFVKLVKFQFTDEQLLFMLSLEFHTQDRDV